MFKKIFNLNSLSTLLLYTSILAFIIAFNFSDNLPSGWYQQFLPDLHGGSIVDLTFTDSLTGYAVTSVDDSSISYILKTSNGGENWFVLLTDTGRNFSRIQFIHNSTGYASTLYGTGTAKFLKTSDGGMNWFKMNNPNDFSEYQDISVISENEVWMCFDNAFTGGVYRTTNSGINWENKYPPQLSNGPTKIYMINSRIGFISNGDNTQAYLKKTTNAGDNWFDVPNGYGWVEMNFNDSLIGWRVLFSVNSVQKTTNGGINWETILNTHHGNPNIGVYNFSIINGNTKNATKIWGVYYDSYFIFPNGQYRFVIFKTSNNGLNWSYQIPDTSIRIRYDYIDFSDSLHGWSYKNVLNGVHTITGGDSLIYPITDISNNYNILPDGILLFQNYPNPFNPVTNIRYQISKNSLVKLKIYNILGKEIKQLVDQKQSAGEYKIEFDSKALPSGIYFYSLSIDYRIFDTKKMILIK